jgi:hypothetical protein
MDLKMANINVLTVVDTEAVLQDYPTESNPNPSTHIQLRNAGKGYVFSLTEWKATDEEQGGDYLRKAVIRQDQEEGGYALNIKANLGDSIQWRMISLNSKMRCQAYLTHLVPAGGWHCIKPPVHTAHPVSSVEIVSSQTATEELVVVSTYDFSWDTTVEAAGSDAYNIMFAIVDSTGANRGQFTIDPYITVKMGSSAQ